MTLLRVAHFALGFLIASSAGSAVAQNQGTREVSQDDEARARRLFEAGDEHYANGRYEDALAAFEESYALSGRPLLLFNMANAQERTGMYEEAIRSLERYLPDAEEDEKARIETRIESLRARAARVRDMTTRAATVAPPEEPGIGAAGPIFLGLAAAAAAGGVVLALRARDARAELDSLCVTGDEERLCRQGAAAAQTRDRRSSISADALFVVGGISLGLGLYFLLRRRDADEGEEGGHVDAVASRDGAYARWSHAF